MKILIVNVQGHSDSTGSISYNLLQYLRNHGHSGKIVCRGGGLEETWDDPDIIELNNKLQVRYSAFMTRLTGYDGIFNYWATNKVVKLFEDYKPDILQIYNPLAYFVDYFKVMEYAKCHDVPMVYGMIDEFAYTGRCAYPNGCLKFQSECKKCPHSHSYPESWFFDRANYSFLRKKRIYQNYERSVYTGPKWVVERAKSSALMVGRDIVELDEPINFGGTFYPKDSSNLRKQLNIPEDNKVVVTVTNMKNPRKGGKYIVDVARSLQNRKDITFVFVGYNTDYSAPYNVIKVPYVSDPNLLADYYSLGDLFVCTSLADTQPNVCLNALGCGTPLCGFDEQGTPYCAPEPLGIFTKTYDIEALCGTIMNAPKKTQEIITACVKYARENYDSDVIFSKQLAIYNKLLNTK